MFLKNITSRIVASSWLVLGLLATSPSPALSHTGTIDVDVDQPGFAIPPTFAGLMTEEINHAYDGGLYAELVQNRTFQDDANAPAHWTLSGDGTMALDRTDPVNSALPVSLRVDLSAGTTSVANDGYWGIPIRPHTDYSVSFFAKGSQAAGARITAALILDDGTTVAQAGAPPLTTSWHKISFKLSTSDLAQETLHAKFAISASGSGSVWLSLVSLFPPTYENHANGLRPDLMQLLQKLHPAFIRLPGGNYLEGNTFDSHFRWKQMIGPVEQRPGHAGCWGYRSSDGFGLPEYLLWCKQLNAETVLALFAGYTLNHDHVNAGPQLQPYVEEALQEIEYVSGPADSEWGKRRAADGLPEPFKLHYVEVGNEDFVDGSGSYEGRYAQFYDAIRARYPDLKIIATTPVKSRKPDLIDDHYYRSAHEMAFDSNHYHQMDRSGSKIFVGEWATQEGNPTPDLRGSLADAAWLMGLEQDADLIPIECYAPLFVNVNNGASQWGTNLIGYDALHSFGSPSYYAQCMFADNRADVTLPARLALDPSESAGAVEPHGAIGVGNWHTQVEYKDISVTGEDGKSLTTDDPAASTEGWTFTGGDWTSDGGVLKPGNGAGETWVVTGDPAWTNYTVRLKAKKDGGDEGFLILFHAADSDNYNWWNIGGWGNTRTSCEVSDSQSHRTPYGPSSDFKVETGRWYDLRLQVHGGHVRCYADDQLIDDSTVPSQPKGPPLFVTAGYIKATSEAIIKVVNMSGEVFDAEIHVRGAGKIEPTAKATVVTGNPTDVNSLANPTQIVPKQESITDVSRSFHRQFPAYSLTLIRLTAPRQ